MASRFPFPIRNAGLVLAGALASGAWGAGVLCQSPENSAAAGSSTQSQPVLVELFTSEGCSDCPPADALLELIDAKQFVPGARVIVLSEHVTYWDRLGWRDPFSLDAVTERQQRYEEHFKLDSSYTPQMVVDGAAQFVGSDRSKLSEAVARAATIPKRQLTIADARLTDGAASFSVHGDDSPGATLIAVLAQNATRSVVARGENAGKTLHHVAVVRAIKEFGSKSTDGRPLRLAGVPSSGADKAAGPLRLVVFLADRKTGRVVGVAEQTLSE